MYSLQNLAYAQILSFVVILNREGEMYAIMRFKKLKSMGEIGGVGSHHSRDRETPNANPEVHNLWLKQPAGGIVQAVGDRLSGIKIRKNGVLAYEFLLTASPEFFRWEDGEISHRRITDFNKKSMAWLREIFGQDNVVSAICHLDEQTPHIQAVVVPIDSRGRLNAFAWTGDKKKLQQLQDSFAEVLAPLGLERGIKGSRAGHTRISEYYSSVNNSVPPTLPEIKVRTPPPFLLTESAREDWAAAESRRIMDEIRPRLQPLADRSAALKLERKRREELEVLLLESRKKAKDDSRVREQEDATTRRKAHYFDFLATYAPGALSEAALAAQKAHHASHASGTQHTDAGSESRVDLLG
jgi:hypothetical protein